MDKGILEIAIKAANIGVWDYNISTNALDWNDTIYKLYGIENTNFYKTYETWKALLHPGDAFSIDEIMQQVIAGKNEIDTEFRVIWPDKSIHYLKARAVVERDTAGNAIRLIGTNWDITDKKQAELASDKASNELRSLFNSNTHVCIIGTDLTGIITHFNKGAEQLLGYTATEVIGKETPSLFHVEEEVTRRIEELKVLHGVDITGFELYEKHLQYGKYEDLYWTYRRKDGTTLPVQLAVSPIKNDANEIIGMLGITTDASENKRFEYSLKESEQRWHLAFEHAAIGMAIVSPLGKFDKVNKSLLKIVGYSETELLSKTFQDITHPDDLNADLAFVNKMLANEIETYQMEKRYFHKNGNTIWISLSVSLVKDEKNKPIYFIAQIEDITKRKKDEEEITYLGRLIKDVNDAVFSTDNQFVIRSWNTAAETLFGYSASEAIGQPSQLLIRQNESTEWRNKVFESITSTGAWKGEATYLRKDNSLFTGLVTLSTTKNLENKQDGYVSFVRDISEIKKLETQQHETIDIISEQNKRLINFAHIVSHNLRSHAGNFSILLDLYSSETSETEKQELIRLLNTASEKLSEAISHLNEVLTIQVNINQERKSIALKLAIEDTIQSLHAQIQKQGVDIIVDVPENLTINYVTSYLDSILLNCLTNSIRYRHPKRLAVITFKTYYEQNSLVLEITDNGIGIDLEKNREKIFGMYKVFHTNKDARGIGLFITKNQVEAMGGKIEVQSTLDIGTTFRIYLS